MMDLHNHTYWSGDAVHSPNEIVENAIENGITTLGFSDHHRSILLGHTKWHYLEKYINLISNIKERYRDKITILKGLEINVNFHQNERENLPYDLFGDLDYALIEHVDGTGLFNVPIKRDCLQLKDIKSIRKNLPKKLGLAHTDLLYLSENYCNNKGILYGIETVTEFLAENDLFWELNIAEHYGYFNYLISHEDDFQVTALFDKLKEKNIKVSAGSDTHFIDDYDFSRLSLANQLASNINSLI